MKDPALAAIFSNCLPNTLDTTVMNFTLVDGLPDTFVVTGDILNMIDYLHLKNKKRREKILIFINIPAMWLRDSTNQVG